MNIKRILTALIGFPIVMLVLCFGNKYIIDISCAIIGIIAMYEFIKCASQKVKIIKWVSYLSVSCIALIHVIPIEIMSYIGIIGVPILLLILFLHVIVTNMKITFEDIVYTLMGIVYIISFLGFLPAVYGIEGEVSGKFLVWFVIFATWGTDVFAYAVGKRFGKTKFSKVSPNKSVEGCVAGALGAVIASLILCYALNSIFNLELSYIIIGVISLILSIIGQIGDFSASVIKRYFEVKDFSNLFPGHGGMIDRIDSVMFAAPFAYMLFTILL